MAENYFEQMLDLAADIVLLADAEAHLEMRDWKKAKERHDNLEVQFKDVRKKYVDALLDTSDDNAAVYPAAARHIEQLKATCDPSWLPAVSYAADSLLPYLEKEASRDPRLRMAAKAAPWVLAGIGIVAYFGVRFWSVTPIVHTIETKEGITERAAAIVKLLRYDDWMDTHVRKGGLFKGVVFWPIEPNDDEIKGASEFAGLAFEAQQFSVEKFSCSAIPRGYDKTPSKEELEYLEQVAEYLQGASVKWNVTPAFTVVDAARAVGKC